MNPLVTAVDQWDAALQTGLAAKNQRIDFPYYRTLDLSLHTRWDDFINAFVP